MLGSIGFHETNRFVTKVELVGGPIVIPGLAHYQDIVATTEGIGVDGNGPEVNIRVVARRLAGGRPVEIPFGELLVALDRTIERLAESPRQ